MTASTLPRWSGDTEPEFILQLARALGDRHDVTVVAPHCPGARRAEVVDGVHIHRFRYAPERWETLAYAGGIMSRLRQQPLRWLLVPAFLVAQAWKVRSLHRESPFDIFHVHWIVPQGLVAAALKIAGVLRSPMLLTSHGGDLFSLQGALFSRLKRWVLGKMDAVNVVSEGMIAHCNTLGVSDDRVFVRSMGVDLSDRFVASGSWESRSGMVFVGRLVEKKGVDVLLRAFARVRREQSRETLTIVGDGPLRESLQRLCKELEIEAAVSFLGGIPNIEVPAVLNLARISVVPSVVASDGDQEGLGLVAVEAMGCGCCVVSSDLPALHDVVEDGINGRMVKAGDPDDLADCLIELLKDPARMSELAEHGRASVHARFSWPAVADDYAAAYTRLIENAQEA
jgi:glycosyltransferase involved in cell wall biosynthesis